MSAHSLLRELFEAESSPVKDPGASGTIKLEGRSHGHCELVSGTSESRTLPAPTASGIWFAASMKTDGGDITLTVTGGFNEDGDTSLTFSDAGQFYVFMSVRTAASTFVWRLISDHTTGNVTRELTATADEINAVADVSARILTVTGTQLTVTAAVHADRDVLLDNTHTVTVTLPAASGSGNRYNFIVKTTGTDGSKIIQVANTTDVINGGSLAVNTQSTTIGFTATASDDTITLNNTTSGGVKGTRVTLLDAASGVYLVNIFNLTTGNPATPFSNAV